MPYSPDLMTFIFIKPRRRTVTASNRLAAHNTLRESADTRFDVRRLGFDPRLSEAGRPADTCVSTPSLCNANFARS
jgi:hypothetical protein